MQVQNGRQWARTPTAVGERKLAVNPVKGERLKVTAGRIPENGDKPLKESREHCAMFERLKITAKRISENGDKPLKESCEEPNRN